MHRVVFDTTVFVRGLINPYSIWGQLVFKYPERYHLFLSLELGNEILAVLARPEVQRKFRVTQEQVLHLATLFEQAEMVELTEIPPVSRDPKDDMVAATAVRARATYLVSEDEDLLDLHQIEGIPVIHAIEFLRMLEKEAENEAS